MRVVSGKLGGRNFQSLNISQIHPMSEKIRGSIFSSLGDISQLEILDAYSGSGAICIEAVSRGAIKATAIESNPKAVKLILYNLEQLGISSQVKIIESRVESWLITASSKYDIIIADPPYSSSKTEVLDYLGEHLSNNGLFVLSWPGKKELPLINGLKLVMFKNFGDAQIGYYKF